MQNSPPPQLQNMTTTEATPICRGNVEVSVVGTPEIFGVKQPDTTPPVSINDERRIERYETESAPKRDSPTEQIPKLKAASPIKQSPSVISNEPDESHLIIDNASAANNKESKPMTIAASESTSVLGKRESPSYHDAPPKKRFSREPGSSGNASPESASKPRTSPVATTPQSEHKKGADVNGDGGNESERRNGSVIIPSPMQMQRPKTSMSSKEEALTACITAPTSSLGNSLEAMSALATAQNVSLDQISTSTSILTSEATRLVGLQRIREAEERDRLNRDLTLAIQASQRNIDIRQLLPPHLHGLLDQTSTSSAMATTEHDILLAAFGSAEEKRKQEGLKVALERERQRELQQLQVLHRQQAAAQNRAVSEHQTACNLPLKRASITGLLEGLTEEQVLRLQQQQTAAQSQQRQGTTQHNNASQQMSMRLVQQVGSLPCGEEFSNALNQWDWCWIDRCRLPAVIRGNDRFIAVHMVQMRLLSKFPPQIPSETMKKFTMVSHKMTLLEAWILNMVNARDCQFDYGCQLFSPNDELVKFTDVSRFYWAVKSLNIERLLEAYKQEAHTMSQLHSGLYEHIKKIGELVDIDYKHSQRTHDSVLMEQRVRANGEAQQQRRLSVQQQQQIKPQPNGPSVSDLTFFARTLPNTSRPPAPATIRPPVVTSAASAANAIQRHQLVQIARQRQQHEAFAAAAQRNGLGLSPRGTVPLTSPDAAVAASVLQQSTLSAASLTSNAELMRQEQRQRLRHYGQPLYEQQNGFI